MPLDDVTVVWELAFPFSTEAQMHMARRYASALRTDPYVRAVEWMALDSSPCVIWIDVRFIAGCALPANRELHGLDLRYPRSGLPLRPHWPLPEQSASSLPPVLANGFQLGDWARRKNHTAVYKITRFKAEPKTGSPLVVLVHVDTHEQISISIPHLLVAYEPLSHPPRITTWHEKLLHEDPF